MENEKIRKASRRRGVPLWEVGRYFGFSEATTFRRLRKPFPPEEEEMWLKAIEELAAIEPEERPYHLFGMG